jgi:hypothetical protein
MSQTIGLVVRGQFRNEERQGLSNECVRVADDEPANRMNMLDESIAASNHQWDSLIEKESIWILLTMASSKSPPSIEKQRHE